MLISPKNKWLPTPKIPQHSPINRKFAETGLKVQNYCKNEGFADNRDTFCLSAKDKHYPSKKTCNSIMRKSKSCKNKNCIKPDTSINKNKINNVPSEECTSLDENLSSLSENSEKGIPIIKEIKIESKEKKEKNIPITATPKNFQNKLEKIESKVLPDDDNCDNMLGLTERSNLPEDSDTQNNISNDRISNELPPEPNELPENIKKAIEQSLHIPEKSVLKSVCTSPSEHMKYYTGSNILTKNSENSRQKNNLLPIHYGNLNKYRKEVFTVCQSPISPAIQPNMFYPYNPTHMMYYPVYYGTQPFSGFPFVQQYQQHCSQPNLSQHVTPVQYETNPLTPTNEVENNEEIIAEDSLNISEKNIDEYKEPVRLSFNLQEKPDLDMIAKNSLAEMFITKKKSLAEKISKKMLEKKKKSVVFEKKERTKAIILQNRKEMMKSKLQKEDKRNKIQEGTNLNTSKKQEPPSTLLSRLASGKKQQITKAEMIKLTNKNYALLPEVKKKIEEEKKKKEFQARMQNIRQLEKVICQFLFFRGELSLLSQKNNCIIVSKNLFTLYSFD